MIISENENGFTLDLTGGETVCGVEDDYGVTLTIYDDALSCNAYFNNVLELQALIRGLVHVANNWQGEVTL